MLKHFSLLWLFLFAFTVASCIPAYGPGTGYEIRGDKVYYSSHRGYQRNAGGDLIAEADASTFHIIDQYAYAKDARYVFYQGK